MGARKVFSDGQKGAFVGARQAQRPTQEAVIALADEGTVPTWVVTLRETMARIDERTNQIPTIAGELAILRETTVPADDYRILAEKVDKLWERDLKGRGDWEEIVPRVQTLWGERSERAGAVRAHGYWLVGLSVIVSVLTIATLLHSLGFNVTVGK